MSLGYRNVATDEILAEKHVRLESPDKSHSPQLQHGEADFLETILNQAALGHGAGP